MSDEEKCDECGSPCQMEVCSACDGDGVYEDYENGVTRECLSCLGDGDYLICQECRRVQS